MTQAESEKSRRDVAGALREFADAVESGRVRVHDIRRGQEPSRDAARGAPLLTDCEYLTLVYKNEGGDLKLETLS